MLESESESLIGWYWGAKPQNMMQVYYNLLCDTAYELGMSIMEIESQFPHLKHLFEWEKQTYADSVNRREAEAEDLQ